MRKTASASNIMSSNYSKIDFNFQEHTKQPVHHSNTKARPVSALSPSSSRHLHNSSSFPLLLLSPSASSMKSTSHVNRARLPLYDEAIALKKEVNKLRSQIAITRSEVRKKDVELHQKEKVIEKTLTELKRSTKANAISLDKLTYTNAISVHKKEYKDMKQLLTETKAKNVQLKHQISISKPNNQRYELDKVRNTIMKLVEEYIEVQRGNLKNTSIVNEKHLTLPNVFSTNHVNINKLKEEVEVVENKIRNLKEEVFELRDVCVKQENRIKNQKLFREKIKKQNERLLQTKKEKESMFRNKNVYEMEIKRLKKEREELKMNNKHVEENIKTIMKRNEDIEKILGKEKFVLKKFNYKHIETIEINPINKTSNKVLLMKSILNESISNRKLLQNQIEQYIIALKYLNIDCNVEGGNENEKGNEYNNNSNKEENEDGVKKSRDDNNNNDEDNIQEKQSTSKERDNIEDEVKKNSESSNKQCINDNNSHKEEGFKIEINEEVHNNNGENNNIVKNVDDNKNSDNNNNHVDDNKDDNDNVDDDNNHVDVDNNNDDNNIDDNDNVNANDKHSETSQHKSNILNENENNTNTHKNSNENINNQNNSHISNKSKHSLTSPQQNLPEAQTPNTNNKNTAHTNSPQNIQMTNEEIGEFSFILVKTLEAKKHSPSLIKQNLIDTLPVNPTTDNYISHITSGLSQLLNCSHSESISKLNIWLSSLLLSENNSIPQTTEIFLDIFANIKQYTEEDELFLSKKVKKYLLPYSETLKPYLLKPFITFNNFKSILDTHKIDIKDDYLQYLFYKMKQFDNPEVCLYELQTEVIQHILTNTEHDSKMNTESDIVISNDEYFQIITSFVSKLNTYLKEQKTDIRTLLKTHIQTVQEERTKEIFEIISIEHFLNVLKSIDVQPKGDLEIYCLYSRYKISDDFEVISVDALDKELKLYEQSNNSSNAQQQQQQVINEQVDENIEEENDSNITM